MGNRVAVLGGGVAGLSAAHELMERGFEVSVWEKKSIPGGKARSVPVPDSGKDGRKDLPGEHGFRFFPRFYHHVTDTMRRIPWGENPQGVYQNLTDTSRVTMCRYGMPPVVGLDRFPRNWADCRTAFIEFHTNLGIPESEVLFFSERVWQILSSCQERRNEEYEKLAWWDFIGAKERSAAYQKFLGRGLTRSLVAAQAEKASTKTVGDIFVQLLFDIAEPGVSSDRVLKGPTNEMWIRPWLRYLRDPAGHGRPDLQPVDYHLNSVVKEIHCENSQITHAVVTEDGGERRVEADYFIAAVPVEVFAPLITPAMRQADPRMDGIVELAQNVAWMNGMQFYFTEELDLPHGHELFVDSQWALTALSQKQFWHHFDFPAHGDGTVRDILSVDISAWDVPGINGKEAQHCSPEDIKDEVWRQLELSLNVGQSVILRKETLRRWFIDPDILTYEEEGGYWCRNEEPLLVNLVDTWRLRPDATTAIPNLFLASDYVRTYTDLATMEGANEAARRAVNGIVAASGAPVPSCQVWNLHEPELFAPWRAHDYSRFKAHEPWDGRLIF